MQELIGLRPQLNISNNYFPPLDVLPDTYQYTVERDLTFRGKNYNATNDGFSGVITLTELALLARATLSRDPGERDRARRRLRRTRRGLGVAERGLM